MKLTLMIMLLASLITIGLHALPAAIEDNFNQLERTYP